MKAVDEAFKSGVNFFDVAPFYASGDAERVCKPVYILYEHQAACANR